MKILLNLQTRSLTVVGQEETIRITNEISSKSDETNELIGEIRTSIAKLSYETKRIKGPEIQARKAKESKLAKQLMKVAEEFSNIQLQYKEKCTARIEREIRIGIYYFNYR